MAAVITAFGVKEFLYRATLKVGRDTNSPVLMANAWHHRSDALSSAVAGVSGGGQTKVYCNSCKKNVIQLLRRTRLEVIDIMKIIRYRVQYNVIIKQMILMTQTVLQIEVVIQFLHQVGILGCFMGFPLCDPLAGAAVAAMVLKLGLTMGWDSATQLVDKSCIESDVKKEIEGICEGN
jgi:divalent metal cation (Fe/Co/Zn/Cd) transporter